MSGEHSKTERERPALPPRALPGDAPAPGRGGPDDTGADLEAFPGPVLVLAPHADDETLACGRLLAALAGAGRRIHILFATDGARSPDVDPAERAALVEIRAREARCAADALGVGATGTSFLGLPDGRLAAHAADLTLGVGRQWAALGPRTVLAPFRFDRHPDHLALSRSAVACAARDPGAATLWEYFVYYRWRLLTGGDVRERIRPELMVTPPTGAFVEHKRRALACYASQTTLYAPGQRRAILPPERVEEVSRAPERFLRHDPARPGRSVLARDARWVPVAHALEPRLKRAKERLAGAFGARHERAVVQGADEGRAARGTDGRAEARPAQHPRTGDRGAGSRARAHRRGAERASAPGASPPPTRVVVFASPFPLPAEWRFLTRVAAHPDLELAGVLCRGAGADASARLRDLWHRRGLLAVPLAAAWLARAALRRGMPPEDAVQRIRARTKVAPDVHAPEILDWVKELDADVGVVYGGPILEPALFTLPRRGTLGVHHGRLPDYRGKKTVFWAIANGESEAGVTIQAINAGIDTGRVVREGAVPIGDRGYAEVSRRVQALGVDLLLDALLSGEPLPPTGERAEPVRGAGQREAHAPKTPASTLYRDPGVGDLLRVHLRRFFGR